ncbi:hypothetical protein [Chryseobacterium sp. JK1]|uniref:hypothetical protein n=1 Tax=Chryseobacterium sp. JK1 TaxID=874294 RepID=UPI003D690409
MTISYYDFQNLADRQAQYDFVLNYGHLISERTASQSKYMLYKVSNFSVELIYNTLHNKIIGMNIFENTSPFSGSY